MKHFFKQTVKFSFVLLLSSCNSFNTVVEVKPPGAGVVPADYVVELEAPTHTPALAISKPGEGLTVKPKSAGARVARVCKPFKLPALGATPALPIKELDRISPNDPLALERVSSKHIEELRRYISEMKAALAKAQARYQASCSNTTAP